MSNPQIQFPEKIQQALQPDGKKETKMLIAQGLLPLPPTMMIEALRILSKDADADVNKKAIETVQKLPESILLNIAQSHKIPETLEFLTTVHGQNEKIIEKIMINPSSSDSTFLQMALTADEKTSTLIANNQVRILRMPQIAENLNRNPRMLKSEMDKLISFLRMNGIVLEGVSAELSIMEIEAILKMTEDPDEMIPQEFLDDHEGSAVEGPGRISLYQFIQTINTGKKIKLALKGNKEARSLLIKDSNKVVSAAVIKNPRITDAEILTICQNRSINDEIIRLICTKPDWVKHYSVQASLASNPKTPFQLGLRFTRMLTANDLKKLSKNKNAPSQLQKIAKELYETKKR